MFPKQKEKRSVKRRKTELYQFSNRNIKNFCIPTDETLVKQSTPRKEETKASLVSYMKCLCLQTKDVPGQFQNLCDFVKNYVFEDATYL